MNWNHEGFDLPPIAPSIGPFSEPKLLELISRHARVGEPELWASESGLVAMERSSDGVSMLCPENLIDYRSPVGAGVAELVAENLGSDDFRFDSLPIEAAEEVMAGIALSGRTADMAEHESAAVLSLPTTFESYMADHLSKKERHEMRRKRRRYEAVLGEAHFVHHTGNDGIFEDFIRFHRMAAGAKGSFMTEKMEAMFVDLAELDGWGLDALVADDGHITAAGFGYQGRDGYYLYNSAYNPELAETSPGVVLLGRLIELTIDRGHQVFDFLKGDEQYKYRLGAEARPLFQLVST